MDSTAIIVACIGLLGTLASAFIASWGQVSAAKISAKAKRKSVSKKKGRLPLVLFLVSLLLILFSIVPAFARLNLFRRTVDLGSQYQVDKSEPSEKGRVIVYKHYPEGNTRYRNVDPDDNLLRVEQVCGIFHSNIISSFHPVGGILGTSYESSEMYVPSWCHIEFTVVDEQGGYIGIRIEAEHLK